MRCEKTLSCRFFKVSNEIYWGVPPALDNIKTEPDKVKLFLGSMFVHKQISRTAQS